MCGVIKYQSGFISETLGKVVRVETGMVRLDFYNTHKTNCLMGVSLFGNILIDFYRVQDL